MRKYPCKDCDARHFACWDRCKEYQKVKSIKIPVDETDLYLKSKGVYYRTQYGWRR